MRKALSMFAFVGWLAGCLPTLAQEAAEPEGMAMEEEAEAEPSVEIGADVALFSRYMFWGLTLSNRPVWQPDVWLYTHGFTFTIWANGEFEKDEGGDDYTSGGSRTGITEIDYSLEYGHTFGAVDGAFGVVRWTYDEDNTGVLGPYAPEDLPPGFENGPDLDSTEIYTSWTWSEAFLGPNVTLYYDVDLYQGLFGWVSVSHDVPVQSTAVTLGALAGFSVGQSDTGSEDLPLYQDEGLTHLELSASMEFAAGATTIAPVVLAQYCIDEFTQTTSATEFDDEFVFTAGLTLSWSAGLG
ncbi:MAG: hypothetical protein ACRD0X_04680, partial [Thermoanaerobaculia bacterium]